MPHVDPIAALVGACRLRRADASTATLPLGTSRSAEPLYSMVMRMGCACSRPCAGLLASSWLEILHGVRDTSVDVTRDVRIVDVVVEATLADALLQQGRPLRRTLGIG